MTKKSGPYVGVTGFMSLKEVILCNDAFRAAAKKAGTLVSAHLKFMVGVLVSSKTFAGGMNKWPNRYPRIAEIPDIFSLKNQPHLLNTIHYHTDDGGTIDEQIDQLIRIAPTIIDAIQLNIRWANPVKLQRIRRKYPNLRIILQVGAGAIEDVCEPGEIFLGQALKAYEGVADDFLVDQSGGRGEPIDVWHAFACIADDEIPSSMQPNVAGGFNASNVYRAKGLMRRLKRPVGLDAEGQLRSPKIPGESKENTDLGDHLIIIEATEYIREAVALVGDAIIRYSYKPSDSDLR